MDDWEDRIRGPGGIRYGVWIPRDPSYVKKQELKAPELPKAPANDWIKIKVVDDQSGEVIPKVALKLKTPDNSTEEHETRLSGLIESLGLQSGNCELSCELKDATLDNTLSFVGVGDKPIGQKSAGEANQGSPATPNPGIKYIASVEEHKVKTSETPKSVASFAGMTWEALAKFNWGTDVPDEINKHLGDDVGCTKKTTDGKNYIFDDSDSPGIVFLPKKWRQSGLATNQVHVIRVQNVITNNYVEITYVNENGNPVPCKRFILVSSNGDRIEGECDEDGYKKVVNLKPAKMWKVQFID
jgi:hypothetical protein